MAYQNYNSLEVQETLNSIEKQLEEGLSATKYLGGRNLVQNTGFYNGTSNWAVFNGASNLTILTSDRTLSSKMARVTINGWNNAISTPYCYCTGGRQYTISVWIKMSVASTVSQLMKFVDSNGTETNPIPQNENISVKANEWVRITQTFIAPDTAVKMRSTPRCTSNISGAYMYLAEFKIEEGNKPSTWVEAPEDIQANINKVMIDIKEFGAVGDGVTDDTAAFQKACAYARDNGSIKLYVPNKTYVIDGYMDLYSNTEIIFAKGAKIIRTANTTTSYLFTVGRIESEGTTGYGGGATNIHVKGGTFVGINEEGKNISFTMNHAQHCLFEDMEFYYGNSNGHCFDLAGCDDITIRHCTFRGRVFVPGKEYVEAIQIDNSTSGGLSGNFSNYDNIPTRNVLVEKCRFLPIKDSSGAIISYAPNPIGSHNYEMGYLFEDIVFRDNYVEDCHYDYGTSTGGWVRFYGVNNVKVLNNTFTATQSQNCRVVSVQTKAIDGSTTASHGVEILDNKFTGFNGSLDSSGQPLVSACGLENYNLEDVTIENNTFLDCYDTTTDLANDKGNDLIYVKYASDVKVNNNYCNISRRMIMVTYSDRIIAENNMINKSYRNGIYFDNCTNYEINDNVFDTTNNSLYLSNNKVGKIDSNTFINNLDMLLSVYKQVVALKAESGVVISNNVFKNTNSTETFDCLIKAYGSPSDLYFLHNKGFGYTIPVINAPSQTDIVIDLGVSGIATKVANLETAPKWVNLSSIATYNTDKGVKDYSTGLAPRIMKDIWGRVYLEGCLTHTYDAESNANVLLFTLPEGYRPAKNHDFVTIASGNDKFNRIIVRPNGTVTITYTNSTGTTPYDVLEGISFTTY